MGEIITATGNVSKVKPKSNKSPSSVNKRDKWGRTSLFYAKKAEEVISLIKAGADVKAKDNDNGTPLHWLSFLAPDAIESAKVLVDNGADVNAKDNRGQVPLHIAVDMGGVKLVSFFIDKGANVNASDNDKKYTPLHFATKGEYCAGVEIVKALLAKGANPNMVDDEGNTPLHLAAKNVRLSFRYFGGSSPEVNLVSILLERGANPNIENNDGDKPSDLAQDPDVKALLAGK